MDFDKICCYEKSVELFVAVNFLILCSQFLGVASIYRYTSFQQGVICHAAQEPLQPISLSHLQQIVSTALESNYSLKALGGRHSASDIICTDGVPVDMTGINHFRYDNKTGHATAGAGATLGSFVGWLHSQGRTIYGIPTYEGVTIGGTIGTGAHGTGFSNPATLSDLVVSVVIVDGLGNVRTITNGETLRALRAHLGLLGIVYEVTVSTIPQYKLHVRNYPQSDSILESSNEILRLARSNDRFQFFWFPTSKQVVLSVGNRVLESTPGECETHFIPEASLAQTAVISESIELMQKAGDHLGYIVMETLTGRSLYQRVPVRTPTFTTSDGKTICDPAVGYSHRMSANRCNQCAWQHGNASVFQFEFAAIIPLSELQSALNSIKSILQEYPMEFPLTGIYFRFLPSSDGLLTLNSDRASVALEWVLIPRKDRFNKPMVGLGSSQAIMQALVQKHAARAHWGKNGSRHTQQDNLLRTFPHLKTFVGYMEQFDPRGIFLNDFGRRLRFGSSKTSLDSYAPYCALVESCICHSDEDCGDGGSDSLQCDFIQDYPVCKENVSRLEKLKANVYRRFLNVL